MVGPDGGCSGLNFTFIELIPNCSPLVVRVVEFLLVLFDLCCNS
jgi:hypothetical protein